MNGIRTIEDLRLRCRIDDEGCWIWTGAAQHYKDRPNPEPRVWMADERICINGKKAAALLAGREIPRGMVAFGKCLKPMCCNPDCIRIGTSKDRGAYLSKVGHLRGCVHRHIANKRAAETRTGFTYELAEWVRDSPQCGHVVAHAIGISRSAVSRIRRGKSWLSVGTTASVFSWRP